MRVRHALLLAAVATVAALSTASCSHLRMGLFVLKDNPRANDPTSIPRGEIAFERNCAQCHGEKADGHGPLVSTLPETTIWDIGNYLHSLQKPTNGLS